MSRLSDFEIIQELGEGAYSKVFKVLRKEDGRHYVMKALNVDTQAVKEISIIASIASPYIVCYKDSFFDRGQLFIIMDYCEKGDLNSYLQAQRGIPLSESKVWRIALEVLSGIAALHKEGIIHRDIKPKNILITRDFKMKIGDFGISAKAGGSGVKELDKMGTLYYTSPEILRSEFCTGKTDIWSFGCLLHELCRFSPPFISTSESAIIAQILHVPQPPIPNFYSKELGLFIDLCLNKNPNLRPSVFELFSLDFIQTQCQKIGIILPEGVNTTSNFVEKEIRLELPKISHSPSSKSIVRKESSRKKGIEEKKLIMPRSCSRQQGRFHYSAREARLAAKQTLNCTPTLEKFIRRKPKKLFLDQRNVQEDEKAPYPKRCEKPPLHTKLLLACKSGKGVPFDRAPMKLNLPRMEGCQHSLEVSRVGVSSGRNAVANKFG